MHPTAGLGTKVFLNMAEMTDVHACRIRNQVAACTFTTEFSYAPKTAHHHELFRFLSCPAFTGTNGKSKAPLGAPVLPPERLLSSNGFEVSDNGSRRWEDQADGGRICSPRSLWLCYGREAILEICLLCYSGTVGACVQTFALYRSSSERPVVCQRWPRELLCVGQLPEVGADFSTSDYSNNNTHGLRARGQVDMLNSSFIFHSYKN